MLRTQAGLCWYKLSTSGQVHASSAFLLVLKAWLQWNTIWCTLCIAEVCREAQNVDLWIENHRSNFRWQICSPRHNPWLISPAWTVAHAFLVTWATKCPTGYNNTHHLSITAKILLKETQCLECHLMALQLSATAMARVPSNDILICKTRLIRPTASALVVLRIRLSLILLTAVVWVRLPPSLFLFFIFNILSSNNSFHDLG